MTDPPDGQAVLVHGDDSVFGFVSAGPSRGRDSEAGAGEVYALFVDPTVWGVGVGGLLLGGAVDHLLSLGLKEARLWVLDKNGRARRFYEERDWSELGEVVKTNGAGSFATAGRCRRGDIVRLAERAGHRLDEPINPIRLASDAEDPAIARPSLTGSRVCSSQPGALLTGRHA